MSIDDRHPGAAFIAKLFGPSTQHPVYVCSLTNDNQPNAERHTITRQPSHIENFAREYDVPGRAVYYAVNTVMEGKDRRCKDTIAEINALYADIDLKDIEEGADTVRTRLEQLLRPPSARVFTGHGFHVLWLLKESVDAQAHRDKVETLLKRLAEVVGGDPSVTEIARLLRLPRTHNSKNGDSIEVVVERCEEGLRYELDDLSDWLDPRETRPILTMKEKPAKSGNGGIVDPDDPFARLAREQGYKPPVNVEQRLADMTYHGAGESSIHTTQLSVAASLAISGKSEDEVVDIVLPATRRAAGLAWEQERWSEEREERTIREMYRTWVKKRGLAEVPSPPPPPPTDAAEALTTGDKTHSHLWRSKDHDFPCTPTGAEWHDGASGRIYAQVSTQDGTSTVPKDELVPAQGGSGTAEGEDDKPPPPADASEIHDDTPPPPDNVADIRPKLKRKGAREAAAPQPQPQPEPDAHKPLIPLRPGHLPETLDAAASARCALPDSMCWRSIPCWSARCKRSARQATDARCNPPA